MTKISKIIPWEDRQHLIDVIQTRNSMMQSSRNVSQGFIDNDVNRLDIYDHCLVSGIYEDGVLDCFHFTHFWGEVRTYSTIMFSRPKHGGREKYENGYDVNLTLSYNFMTKNLEEMGYYNCYQIYNDSPQWKPHYQNPYNKFNIYRNVVIEKVPAGSLPSPGLRHHLLTNPVDVHTQVVFRSLPTELRGQPFDTTKFPIN